MRSRSWDRGGYRLCESCGKGRDGGEASIAFCSQFCGRRGGGVGLDWTPLAPLGTPWAMGAGEKNGIRSGEDEGEGRFYRGIYLVPPKCQRCPQVLPPGKGLTRPGAGAWCGAGTVRLQAVKPKCL